MSEAEKASPGTFYVVDSAGDPYRVDADRIFSDAQAVEFISGRNVVGRFTAPRAVFDVNRCSNLAVSAAPVELAPFVAGHSCTGRPLLEWVLIAWLVVAVGREFASVFGWGI